MAAVRAAGRRTASTVQAMSAAFLLTMRIFDLIPVGGDRPQTAIVRELTTDNRFDPRECLPTGVVLTLPFDPTHQGARQFVEFEPN